MVIIGRRSHVLQSRVTNVPKFLPVTYGGGMLFVKTQEKKLEFRENPWLTGEFVVMETSSVSTLVSANSHRKAQFLPQIRPIPTKKFP